MGSPIPGGTARPEQRQKTGRERERRKRADEAAAPDPRAGGREDPGAAVLGTPTWRSPLLAKHGLRVSDLLHDVGRRGPMDHDVGEAERRPAAEGLCCDDDALHRWLPRPWIDELFEIGANPPDEGIVVRAWFDDTERLSAAEVDAQQAAMVGGQGKGRGPTPVGAHSQGPCVQPLAQPMRKQAADSATPAFRQQVVKQRVRSREPGGRSRRFVAEDAGKLARQFPGRPAVLYAYIGNHEYVRVRGEDFEDAAERAVDALEHLAHAGRELGGSRLRRVPRSLNLGAVWPEVVASRVGLAESDDHEVEAAAVQQVAAQFSPPVQLFAEGA